MTSVKLHSHVGRDGLLKLEVPVGLAETDVEIMIILHPIEPVTPSTAKTPEELGWPPGFFERTAGSIPDFPDIEPEGDFEIREELV